MKRLTKAERERIRQYHADRAALIEKALQMSVEGLQSAVIDEYGCPLLPYMIFDSLLMALEIKMGRKEYNIWIENL